MKLSQLRHFLGIAQHGSFHRAAEALHTSQQALSASMGKLEASMGAALFDRGPNGVVLTPSGIRLIHRAKLICSEADRAQQEIREIEDAQHGTVRLGVGGFFAERLVPVFLDDYLKRSPSLNISVIQAPSQDLFSALTHGEIDFSLSTPPAGLEIPFELEHEVLFTMPAAVHMRYAHPLARASRIDLEHLVDYSWVVAPAHTDRLSSAFSAAGFAPPRRVIKTDAFPVIRYLVTESDYLVLGADAPPELSLFAAGTVVARPIPELSDPIRAVLVWRKSTPLLPSAGRLMEQLKATYIFLGKKNLRPSAG